MTHPFVPLLQTSPGSSAAADSASGGAGEGFMPLAAAAGLVTSLAALPAPLPEPAAPVCATAAAILLKREGDQVTQVQIRCSCGEVIELNCVY